MSTPRPSPALLLSVSLVVLLASCATPDADPEADRTTAGAAQAPRHLVLVSLDTFRADHLRPALTPRLAELADESVRFDDFVTAAPSTLASHTSLFTGLYPHRHGVASNGWMVPAELETLAEVLHGAGFHTAGVVGSFALLDRFDVDQGFGYWDQEFDQTVGVDPVDQNQRRADRVVDATLAYLDGHPGDDSPAEDRLFLFVHLFDAHYPYDPPGDRDLAPQATPELHWTDDEREQALAVDEVPVDELARRYAGEVAFVDAQVGRLLDELERRGLLDESLLVVVSDHGEALWQHGERWHATEVYDTTTHGLFFARLPAGESDEQIASRIGGVVSGSVGTVDVMPTILRTLGLPVPEGLDGEAFDLRNPPQSGGSERRRFSQATGSHLAIPPESPEVASAEPWARWPNFPMARSVRQGRWKLIQWPQTGREALFDLAADPSERDDLVEEPPVDVDVGVLRQDLESWARSADPLPSHFDRDFELDTRRQLCALGYVECPDEE